MVAWQLLCIIGVAFAILEIFTPSLFFLNFALAAFITAVLSLYVANKFALALAFFVMSFLSFLFLRPLILRRHSKETETGIAGKYINKIAKAEEEISEFKGVISIYGERCDARSADKSVIPSGCYVKIVKNDSLIMYVVKSEN